MKDKSDRDNVANIFSSLAFQLDHGRRWVDKIYDARDFLPDEQRLIAEVLPLLDRASALCQQSSDTLAANTKRQRDAEAN